MLALDDALRARLLDLVEGPGERLIVLLAGVHALRPSQICPPTLDGIGPAADTLPIGGRARPLDQLTTGHLGAWLQAQQARWPATANPHLLINRSTAGAIKPASRSYVQATVRRAGITARDLLADRLLDQALPVAVTRAHRLSGGRPAAVGSRQPRRSPNSQRVPRTHSPRPQPGPSEPEHSLGPDGAREIELRPMRVLESSAVTHLTFRVMR